MADRFPDGGACVGSRADFTPENGGRNSIRQIIYLHAEAISICNSCSIQDGCLSWFYRNGVESLTIAAARLLTPTSPGKFKETPLRLSEKAKRQVY